MHQFLQHRAKEQAESRQTACPGETAVWRDICHAAVLGPRTVTLPDASLLARVALFVVQGGCALL